MVKLVAEFFSGNGAEMLVWNIILTGLVALLSFFMKGKFDELNRLGILLNQTREQIAREHVTRAEVNQTIERLADRIESNIMRLEQKIDGLATKG